MPSDTNPTQTPPEPGALASLADEHARGVRFAAKPDLAVGHVKGWLAPVRRHLKQIFGAESAVVSLVPQIDGPMPREDLRALLLERVGQLQRFLEEAPLLGQRAFGAAQDQKVFIGHGRSLVWREVQNFIATRLRLPWDEFNREPVAGISTSERLAQMLSEASFALLIMTAEDEHADGAFHARENVVHEVGLFQGRLGPRKAIILQEVGCAAFSNIHGLSVIRFPAGHVSAAFEQVREVLERERIIRT